MTRSISALVLAISCAASAIADLTPAEKAAGWRMLFDGETLDGWRSYGGDGPPEEGWETEDGTLRVVAGGGGGDILTTEEFGDFELSLEFRTAPGANSGIMYRVAETQDRPWQTGAEFQVLDDFGQTDLSPEHAAGACYDLYAPNEDKALRPAGEWNHARIYVRDGLVKHFLNGVKVVEYDMDGEAWAARIEESKFSEYEGFGVQPRGHIALQDHGNDVWYREIRVRELDGRLPGQKALFDGESLEGWSVFRPDESDAATWVVRDDGVLACYGRPFGYIETKDRFGDFVLMLRWRFSPVTKQGGNSGVLLRTVGEDKLWPDCIEAQLHSGNAGDFWNLSGEPIDMPRPNGRNGKKSHHAERPLGEWNEYEIVADGGRITLSVNGEKLNEAIGCPERAGTIGLQSEGVEIHFRDVRLAPID